VTVTVNGTARKLAGDETVADVVAELVDHPAGVAVAVNDEVVPRTHWSRTPVRGGDRIEVLTAVQGG
jgi:sulfur carrier protein